MTLTPAIDSPKPRIDWTKPVLWLFAACLVVLIVLPMSWLAVFSFTDKARHPTLQNFVTLFTDPDFLDPLLTTAIIGGGAWTTARRVTIPLALPALVAGALIAFLQAMTLFGSPAILALPAGFHTMTTKIWSLFQYPPKLELAAAAAVPLLLLTILLLQAQKFILGRRGYSVLGGKYGAPRQVEMKRWRWAALAFCLVVLLNPVFLPYFALFNAAFSPNATTLVTPATLTLHNIVFVFTELSSTQLALKNTVILGAATATIGTMLALVIAYVTTRRVIAGSRVLGFLATAPVAVPGIVLGVGLFLSYTRPPFVLYGTLWILLLAFLTINLPSSYH